MIPLAKKGGNEQTDVDFIGQMRDAKGKLISTVRDEIRVKLSETRAGQLGTRSLQYDTGFTVPPGTYDLKFLVRENGSGKMGTFQTPLVVPDLTAAADVLRLSSVVWSSQRQSMQEAVGSAGARKKDLAANPLIRDGQKLVPSITRAFRKDQNLYVYLEVYDPTAADPDSRPNVAAVLSFYRGKRKAFESSPVRLTQFAEGRPERAADLVSDAVSSAARGQIYLPGGSDRRERAKVCVPAGGDCAAAVEIESLPRGSVR